MKLMFKYFIRSIKTNKKYFFVSLLILLILCVVNIMIPFALRLFLNNIPQDIDILYMTFGIFGFIGLYTLTIVLDILWNISLDKFAGKYIKTLLQTCQSKLSNTYYENIDQLNPNLIKNILFGDVLDVFRIVGRSIPTILSSILIIIEVSTLSLIIDYKMAGFILLSILVGIALAFLSRKKLDRVGSKTNRSIKELNGINIEFVDTLESIQNNNLLKYYNDKTENMVNNFMNSAINEDCKICFWTGLVSNYNSLFSLFLSIFLSLPFANNSLVNMAFFILLSNIIIQYSQKLELTIQQIMRSLVCFRNLESIMVLPQRTGVGFLTNVNEIELKSISFAYPKKEKTIFKDLSLSLKKGDCLKLEGANGSGKSTLIKLLTDLYSVCSGEIRYNDVDIKDLDHQQLTKMVLYISQEETFVNEKIEDYLKIMGSNSNLKEGTMWLDIDGNYVIENNGTNLSVGQRKKLLILKLLSMYNEAQIIILDEIFAGLDTEAKSNLTNFLNTKIKEKDKIFIFISHEETNLTYNKKLSLKIN